jgi:hypothetical protein
LRIHLATCFSRPRSGEIFVRMEANQTTMDKDNMPDGSAAVWLNGSGDIGDKSRRYFHFLTAAIFSRLFHCWHPTLFSFNYL